MAPTSCFRQAISLVTTLVTLALAPVAAAAQTSKPVATESTPWDVALLVGLLSAHTAPPGEDQYDDWFHVAEVGVVTGRHLSPQLKIEVEFSASEEGRQLVWRTLAVPGAPYRAGYSAYQRPSLRQLGGAITWQFFDNQWIHPFVQAGLFANHDRVRTHIRQQTLNPFNPRPPTTPIATIGPRDEEMTSTTLRGMVGAGAKLYVSPRVFFRIGGRVIAGSRHQHITLRLGAGLDF